MDEFLLFNVKKIHKHMITYKRVRMIEDRLIQDLMEFAFEKFQNKLNYYHDHFCRELQMPQNQALDIFFYNWFMFDFRLSPRNKATLIQFYQREKKKINKTELQLLNINYLSFVGFYDIIEVLPNYGVLVEDLITEEIFFVYDISLSTNMCPFTPVLCRFLRSKKLNLLAGTAIPFDRDLMNIAIKEIKQDPHFDINNRIRFLKNSHNSIFKILSKEMNKDIPVYSEENDPIELTTITIDHVGKNRIYESIQDMKELVLIENIPQKSVFEFIGDLNSSPISDYPSFVERIVITANHYDLMSKNKSLGSIELTYNQLIVFGISARRAEYIYTRIKDVLTGLVQNIRRKREKLQYIKRGNRYFDGSKIEDLKDNPLAIQGFLEPLIKWFETKVPILGNQSPQEASQHPDLNDKRKILTNLLKNHENMLCQVERHLGIEIDKRNLQKIRMALNLEKKYLF